MASLLTVERQKLTTMFTGKSATLTTEPLGVGLKPYVRQVLEEIVLKSQVVFDGRASMTLSNLSGWLSLYEVILLDQSRSIGSFNLFF